ncbi:MAG: hypothetical protein WDZ38_04615 [Balneolaceae bacterium]
MKSTALLLLSIFVYVPLLAQTHSTESSAQDEPINPDRIGSYYSAFPLGGYSSDWGFYGGGYLQRIDYGLDVRPFVNNFKVDFVVSTKGYIVSQAEYERTQTFGLNFRSRIEFIGQRISEGHYFGIGNNTEFDDEQFEHGYYYYENREFFLKYIGRKRIAEYGTHGKVDLYGTTSIWQVNSMSNGSETLFDSERPTGTSKSRVGKVGAGLMIDSRDSEFTPSSGIQYDIGFNIAPALFDFSYSEAIIDLRHYINPFSTVIFAHRFKYEEIFGDAPFWALPVIGNEMGLRGFHLNRFRGGRTILQMAEIRSWLFSVWNDEIRVGAQLFWDSGRVFSNHDSNAFFDQWKHTFGIGTAINLFSPDFILRTDIGFSNESIRIYFGSGFVF